MSSGWFSVHWVNSIVNFLGRNKVIKPLNEQFFNTFSGVYELFYTKKVDCEALAYPVDFKTHRTHG